MIHEFFLSFYGLFQSVLSFRASRMTTDSLGIVSLPPFQNWGNPNKVSKRASWSKPKEGKDYQRDRGNPTFQAESKDRKGQKRGLLEINQRKFLLR